jgi:predicted acyl esterase
MRGSGNSTGLYFDEYEKQEQQDACEIIGSFDFLLCLHLLIDLFSDWVSKQTWSDGKVGMFGKSWGGFNGLQVAYCQPPALKAVISIYSTGLT